MASWRFRARVLAVVDLVAISLLLCSFLLDVIFASKIADMFIQRMKKESIESYNWDEQKESVTVLIQSVLVILAVLVVPFLILEVYLFKATKQGVDTVFALKVTKIWRVVYIIMAALGVLLAMWLMFGGAAMFFEAVSLVFINLFWIYVVCKYIQELEDATANHNAVSFLKRLDFA